MRREEGGEGRGGDGKEEEGMFDPPPPQLNLTNRALQSTQLVPDVEEVHTLWNTGLLNALETVSTRQEIFGDENRSLEVLTDEPRKAVLMSRRTL